MTAPGDDAPAFVDTNVIVYAYDRAAGRKHHTARSLIAKLVSGGNLRLSAQILNELAAVLLRRRGADPLPIEQIIEIIEEVRNMAEVVPLSGVLASEALAGVRRHGLSFWDALVWATARDHGVGRIYSEDFQHGRELEGVVFVNPFLENTTA
jgi:predicted nucleic acid-binding protein